MIIVGAVVYNLLFSSVLFPLSEPKHKIIDISLWTYKIIVKGDVKIVFYDHDNFSAPDKMVIYACSRSAISSFLLAYLRIHSD